HSNSQSLNENGKNCVLTPAHGCLLLHYESGTGKGKSTARADKKDKITPLYFLLLHLLHANL
ncbi:MAG: hypothetical protein J7L94_16000, partial [Caldisericaceae bacterium]|nr:hypothetical protein [Caldisericaceae bacterium]